VVMAARSVWRASLQRDRERTALVCFSRAARRLRAARAADRTPAAESAIVQDTHVPRFRRRRASHAPGDQRPALPAAAVLSARVGNAGLAVGPDDDAL